jgi:hypothetical protein
MSNLNKILISCVFFIAVTFQVNSNDKIYKYLINESITYDIFSYSKLLENHNLNIEMLNNKVSNVLIVNKFRKDSICFYKNGLPKSLHEFDKLKYKFEYYIKEDSVILSGYDQDSELISLIKYNLKMKKLKVESYIAMYDANVQEYEIKQDNYKYIVIERHIAVIDGYSDIYGEYYYTYFDSKLGLLEKGKMNLNFFDFLCDSYYPYLNIDYYKDSIEFKFDYDKYDSFKFAPRHQSFTKTFLNDSMAVIDYKNRKKEVDEKIYYYNNGLPKLYISYIFPDQPDTTRFEYKYYKN